MQNGRHDLVDSLDLLLLEAYHFHGISYRFELCTVIDGTLQGKRCLGRRGLREASCEKGRILQACGKYLAMFQMQTTVRRSLSLNSTAHAFR